MSLQIKCTECSQTFWVEGHSTPDGFYDPGEIIIPDKPDTFSECCVHIQESGQFEVVKEDEDFDDFGPASGWESEYEDE